jgi:hypothetical protein
MVAASFLPESFKEDFPDSVKDMDKRENNPYFSWFIWKKNKKGEDKKESK